MTPLQRNAALSCATAMIWALATGFALASSSRAIVPGKRIGLLALKSYPGKLPLGTPQASDAGMNQREYLWIAKRRMGSHVVIETTFAKAVNNAVIGNGGPGVTIETIRVTSPYFRTAGGVGPGKCLAAIRRRYPHLRPDASYSSVLEDSARGIAFEFASRHPAGRSRCIAVSVFKPGDPVVWVASQIDQIPRSR